MRDQLKQFAGDRYVFTGRFVRVGVKDGYMGPLDTVLLEDIQHEGKTVADHLWFNRTKGFKHSHLSAGDTVEFAARCEWYEKGYKGRDEERQLMCPRQWDLKLSRPTKVKRIKRKEES